MNFSNEGFKFISNTHLSKHFHRTRDHLKAWKIHTFVCKSNDQNHILLHFHRVFEPIQAICDISNCGHMISSWITETAEKWWPQQCTNYSNDVHSHNTYIEFRLKIYRKSKISNTYDFENRIQKDKKKNWRFRLITCSIVYIDRLSTSTVTGRRKNMTPLLIVATCLKTLETTEFSINFAKKLAVRRNETYSKISRCISMALWSFARTFSHIWWWQCAFFSIWIWCESWRMESIIRLKWSHMAMI